MILSAGVLLGGYALERRLALGGMAEVWSATREGRRYALKVLLDMFARDPKLRAMFEDEANLSRRFDHPNVVRVEALIQDGGAMAQVMPLVEGRDVRRLLQGALERGVTVPVPLVALVGREAARGLGYAHGLLGADGAPLGLVHRDVSPHNVMVDRRGHVQVLDFGVARARDRMTRTTVGTVKGKLAYMAPEQMMGEMVTAAADVWSLGVVLWEMLALRRLFGAASDAELVHLVTSGEIPSLRGHRPDVPPRLEALVLRMLAHDPTQRPQGMAAVEATLDELAGDGAALAAWVAPFMDPHPRKTGLLVPPAITDPRHTATVATPFDDQSRDADDLLDTAPPGAPTEAVTLPPGILDGAAPTEAVALPSARRRPDIGAAPTEAIQVGDLLGTVPDDGGRTPPGGYDVAAGSGRLDERDQVAETRAQISRPPRADDAATVLPTVALGPPRRPTPPTPLMTPRVPLETAPGGLTAPLPTPEIPAPRATLLWVSGGLLVGVALMVAARTCA